MGPTPLKSNMTLENHGKSPFSGNTSLNGGCSIAMLVFGGSKSGQPVDIRIYIYMWWFQTFFICTTTWGRFPF